ncbi:2TM domain-containing protein [uncultured Lutibacter sp.]|uniref:2TM domain-containing protein n=1 Tax=uncultured Lutibacter sp. TaxID=437739 RepID=UPI00260E4D37|nr:2TM domain-containing protein [uncultured Lutibacter sp.]
MKNNNYTEEQQYLRAKKRVKAIKGFYVHLTVYLLVNIFLIVSRSFSNGEFEDLWDWQTYNTAIFWGIGILFHAFNVFGMGILLGKNWEDRKIKELMDKDKRDSWE